MNSIDKIVVYHGTAVSHANELVKGNVKVNVGGGELGCGFYLGTALHVAKAWAKQRHNCESVVEFEFEDDEFWDFEILSLSREEAQNYRLSIKKDNATRHFTFGADVVWSPIVGGPKVYSDQHKWESQRGESFLNGNNVSRAIK